jgi:hypothetical protein
MRTNRSAAGLIGLALAVPAAVVALAGLGSGSATAAVHPTAARGCPAGGTTIPAGAGTARTADLDGDDRADTLWLADVNGLRTLGVRTASGAGFTTTFQSAAPQAASATAGLVQQDIPIILLDTGRAAPVYTVVNCAIVPTKNVQGNQYTFDKGFTGYGTGAGCVQIDGTRRYLVGYLATTSDGASYTVARTQINLSGSGRQARNGTTTTLGTHLAADSATVQAAEQIRCGADGTAYEPQ